MHSLAAQGEKAVCKNCRLEFHHSALFCPGCGTAQAAEAGGDPILGTTVGDRYMMLERIGQGASGTIYRAEHVTLRRRVAVKVLHDELSRDDLAVERFRREATTVGQLENEHIVEIYDFGRTPDGRLYLAMEFLEGETLTDIIDREGCLDVDKTVDVLIQLGEALMEAHAMGYVHRDLRPRNLFLAVRRTRANFLKLLDFGLAKLVEREGEAASTSLGMTFGDPHYMSPEQAKGDPVDRRADIYSMGCIAYELLTGDPPFSGEQVFDVLTHHVETPPVDIGERRSDIPVWLQNAIMRCLHKDPEDRFITVYRLVEALRQGHESGAVMGDDVALSSDYATPPSVSRAMERLGRRDDSDAYASTEYDGKSDDVGGAQVDGSDRPEQRVPSQAAAPLIIDDDETEKTDAPTQVAVPAGKRRAPAVSGISAAWYADGDALEGDGELDPRDRDKLRRARRTSDNDDLLAPSDSVFFHEARRRWGIVAAVVGGLALAIFAVAMLWPEGDDKSASDEAEKAAVAAVENGTKEPVEVVPAPETVEEPTEVEEATDDAEEATDDAEEAPPATEKASSRRSTKSATGRSSKGSTRPSTKGSSSEKSATREKKGLLSHIGEDAEKADKPETKEEPVPEDEAPEDREPEKEEPPVEPPVEEPENKASAGSEAEARTVAEKGTAALQSGDIIGAATHFKRALELDPKNFQATLGLGDIALSQGSYSAAITHLRKAVRLRSGNATAHTLLGDALLGDGQNEQAAESFKKALKINPDNARARNGYNEAIGL